MLYLTEPKDFSLSMRVVGCFLECGDEFLILRRAPHKPQGGMWGLPSGKIETGESPEVAMAREMLEETGYHTFPRNFVPFKLYFVRYRENDFTFQMYSLRLQEKPPIRIDLLSHTEDRWVTSDVALRLENLMPDFSECISDYFKLP